MAAGAGRARGRPRVPLRLLRQLLHVQELLRLVQLAHADALVAAVEADVRGLVEEPLHAVGRDARVPEHPAVGAAHDHVRQRGDPRPELAREVAASPR